MRKLIEKPKNLSDCFYLLKIVTKTAKNKPLTNWFKLCTYCLWAQNFVNSSWISHQFCEIQKNFRRYFWFFAFITDYPVNFSPTNESSYKASKKWKPNFETNFFKNCFFHFQTPKAKTFHSSPLVLFSDQTIHWELFRRIYWAQ